MIGLAVFVRTSSSPPEPWRNGSFGFAYWRPNWFFSSSFGRFVGCDLKSFKIDPKGSRRNPKAITLRSNSNGAISYAKVCIYNYTHVYDHVFKQHVEKLIHVPVLTFKPNRWYRNLRSLDPYSLLLRSMWCEHWGHLERTGGGLGKGYINRSGDIQWWCKVTKNTRMTLEVLHVYMYRSFIN